MLYQTKIESPTTDNVYIDKENADKYKTVMQISDR